MKEPVAMELLEKHISIQQMSTYPNIKNQAVLLKIKTTDDEIKNLKYQTRKHDHENKLKSPKIDCPDKKNYKSLNKKQVFMIVPEILIEGIGLSVVFGLTISGLAPVGIICASSISFLSSIATLITNE